MLLRKYFIFYLAILDKLCLDCQQSDVDCIDLQLIIHTLLHLLQLFGLSSQCELPVLDLLQKGLV